MISHLGQNTCKIVLFLFYINPSRMKTTKSNCTIRLSKQCLFMLFQTSQVKYLVATHEKRLL